MSLSPASSSAVLRRLRLTNFRSYRRLSIDTAERMIVLTGPNGAGKTNILEAISLLAPGRGLRRASMDALACTDGDGSWAVAAELEGALGLATLGTGVEPPRGASETSEATAAPRKCRIDGESVPSPGAFAEHLALVWLTPGMDGLFSGPASERRRFLDRLVLTVDSSHSGRVSALERALRSRNRLLEAPRPDPHWLDAIEHETAELAVAVAAGRVETVTRLSETIARRSHESSPFPSASIDLDGQIEHALPGEQAIALEDRYRALLKANRARDAAAGRTLEGPHLTDLRITHQEKRIAAEQCSTGEQKALLIGLVLAQAQLVGAMRGTAPLLLLDEVVAHLDPMRRSALFAELDAIGGQVWLSGADPAAFAELGPRTATFVVAPGTAVRQ